MEDLAYLHMTFYVWPAFIQAIAAQEGTTDAELLWLISLHTERPSKAIWISNMCKTGHRGTQYIPLVP